MVGDWQACSKCPKGKRERIVKCVRSTGEGEGEIDVIPDWECAKPKPRSKEKCSCETEKPTSATPFPHKLSKRLLSDTSPGPCSKQVSYATKADIWRACWRLVQPATHRGRNERGPLFCLYVPVFFELWVLAFHRRIKQFCKQKIIKRLHRSITLHFNSVEKWGIVEIISLKCHAKQQLRFGLRPGTLHPS